MGQERMSWRVHAGGAARRAAALVLVVWCLVVGGCASTFYDWMAPPGEHAREDYYSRIPRDDRPLQYQNR